jgi:hypothetical protein
VHLRVLTASLIVFFLPAMLEASSAHAKRGEVIEQSVVDRALERLIERQRQRQALGTTTRPAPTVHEPALRRKHEMLREYDQWLQQARFALRNGQAQPGDVQALVRERGHLERLPLVVLSELIEQAEQLNGQRVARYRQAFGELHDAGQTVVTILTKSGLIESATRLDEDPLTQEIEEAHGIRRVYYRFVLPSAQGTQVGHVEFAYSPAQELWIPTWARVAGQQLALIEAPVFLPLRPYRVMYNGSGFVVGQAPPNPPTMLISLLQPQLTFAR